MSCGVREVTVALDKEASHDTFIIIVQTQVSDRVGSPGGATVAIDELSRHRRIGVLLICCMSLFIVGLDASERASRPGVRRPSSIQGGRCIG
jgi:hypothetical protein